MKTIFYKVTVRAPLAEAPGHCKQRNVYTVFTQLI